MTRKALRSTGQLTKKRVRKKTEKEAPPASSLRKLAGGWTRKEANEVLISLEPFDQISKVVQK